jgi:hypothetical protein
MLASYYLKTMSIAVSKKNNAYCRGSNAYFYVMLTKISSFSKPLASFDADRSTCGACELEVIIKYSRRRTGQRQGIGGGRKRFQTEGGTTARSILRRLQCGSTGAGGGGIDLGQCQYTIQKAHDAFNYAWQSKA